MNMNETYGKIYALQECVDHGYMPSEEEIKILSLADTMPIENDEKEEENIECLI